MLRSRKFLLKYSREGFFLHQCNWNFILFHVSHELKLTKSFRNLLLMKTIIWFWFQKLRKFFPWTFLGSIIWIAGFTYFMVWWATMTGETLGIPPAVRSPLSFARDKLLQNYRALSYEILRNLQKSWKSRKILWILNPLNHAKSWKCWASRKSFKNLQRLWKNCGIIPKCVRYVWNDLPLNLCISKFLFFSTYLVLPPDRISFNIWPMRSWKIWTEIVIVLEKAQLTNL